MSKLSDFCVELWCWPDVGCPNDLTINESLPVAVWTKRRATDTLNQTLIKHFKKYRPNTHFVCVWDAYTNTLLKTDCSSMHGVHDLKSLLILYRLWKNDEETGND